MCKPVAGFVTANLKGQIDSSVYFILWRKLCSLLARFDQLFRYMRCEGSIVGAIGYRRLYDRVPQAISEEVHMCYGKGRTHSPYVRSSRVQPPNGHPHSLLQRKSGRTDRSCRCHMRHNSPRWLNIQYHDFDKCEYMVYCGTRTSRFST